MSEQTAALDLLRAMLAGGEPVDTSARPPVYRRPTLYHTGSVPAGAMISERADERFLFGFTESDGTRVSYEGTVSQDDLFRVLYAAGLLSRRQSRG